MRLLIVTCVGLLFAMQVNAQFMYGSADMGAGYRPKAITSKGQVITDEKKATGILNINGGYKIHFENENSELNLLLETNTRLPIIDNTNAISSGIRLGWMIPVGRSMHIIPMTGAWVNYRNPAGTQVTAGGNLRMMFTSEDYQWYADASYINGIAGITIGLVFLEHKKL